MVACAFTVLLSGFLLFLLQPLVAKQLLPWFGGSAAVWTVCMMFFQVGLLLGNVYAHWLVRRCTPRLQALIHTALLGAAAATLPVIASDAVKPAGGSDPSVGVLWALLLTTGLPYFLLSSTSPLVQHWFAQRVRSRAVYRLFAVSNFGSLLALVAYPFVVEPFADVDHQAWGWSAGFCVFALACAVLAWRWARAVDAYQSSVTPHRASPGLSDLASWVGLSALGSVLLLGITSHLTQNIASVPFLWVLPLALYLVSFVLVFEGRGGRGWYSRHKVALPALGLVVLMAARLSVAKGTMHVAVSVPLYSVGLALACLFVHGELGLRKPAQERLTFFYLALALGGALGGLFVGLAAPRLFPAYYELPLALFAVGVVAYRALVERPRAAGFALFAALAAAFFGIYYVEFLRGSATTMERNFYGTLRVIDRGEGAERVRQLVHGVVVHGEERPNAPLPRQPGAYFSPSSGVGRAVAAWRAEHPGRPIRIGVIGLGIGTIAAYGNHGDRVTFFELDGDVDRLARSYFTFLSNPAALVDVKVGDGRLMLEDARAKGAEPFDVFVIDAFSSDAIPAHLLTAEAFTLYARMVASEGVIAVHVSNKFLDLAPVVQAAAAGSGFHALYLRDVPQNVQASPSEWVVLARDERLVRKALGHHGVPIRRTKTPWTDRHNNLFGVLRL